MAGDASLGITPVMKWNFERSCYRWLVTRHPAQFERLDFTAQILQSASRARKAFYDCGWAEAKVLIRPSDGKFERTPFFDTIIRRGLRNSTRFDASTLTEEEIDALGMHRDESLGFKLQIRHFRSTRKELPPQGRGGGGGGNTSCGGAAPGRNADSNSPAVSATASPALGGGRGGSGSRVPPPVSSSTGVRSPAQRSGSAGGHGGGAGRAYAASPLGQSSGGQWRQEVSPTSSSRDVSASVAGSSPAWRNGDVAGLRSSAPGGGATARWSAESQWQRRAAASVEGGGGVADVGAGVVAMDAAGREQQHHHQQHHPHQQQQQWAPWDNTRRWVHAGGSGKTETDERDLYMDAAAAAAAAAATAASAAAEAEAVPAWGPQASAPLARTLSAWDGPPPGRRWGSDRGGVCWESSSRPSERERGLDRPSFDRLPREVSEGSDGHEGHNGFGCPGGRVASGGGGGGCGGGGSGQRQSEAEARVGFRRHAEPRLGRAPGSLVAASAVRGGNGSGNGMEGLGKGESPHSAAVGDGRLLTQGYMRLAAMNDRNGGGGGGDREEESSASGSAGVMANADNACHRVAHSLSRTVSRSMSHSSVIKHVSHHNDELESSGGVHGKRVTSDSSNHSNHHDNNHVSDHINHNNSNSESRRGLQQEVEAGKHERPLAASLSFGYDDAQGKRKRYPADSGENVNGGGGGGDGSGQPHAQTDRGRMTSVNGSHAQQAWPRGHQGMTTPPPSSHRPYDHHDRHAHDHDNGQNAHGHHANDRRGQEEEHEHHARDHRAYRAQFEALEKELVESERELLSSRVALEVAEARHEEACRVHSAKQDQLFAAKRLHHGSEPPARMQGLDSPSLHSLGRSCEAAASEKAVPSREVDVQLGGSKIATGGGDVMHDEDRSDGENGKGRKPRRRSAPAAPSSAAPSSAATAAVVVAGPADEPSRPLVSPSAATEASSDAIRVDEMMEVKLEAALLCGIGRAPGAPVFSRGSVCSSSSTFSSSCAPPPPDDDVKRMDVVSRAASTATASAASAPAAASAAAAADRRRGARATSPSRSSGFHDGTPQRGVNSSRPPPSSSCASSSTSSCPLPSIAWGLSSPGAGKAKTTAGAATVGGAAGANPANPDGKSAGPASSSSCSLSPSPRKKARGSPSPHGIEEANANSHSNSDSHSSSNSKFNPNMRGTSSNTTAKKSMTSSMVTTGGAARASGSGSGGGSSGGSGGGGGMQHGRYPPPSSSQSQPQSSSSSSSSMASRAVDSTPSSSSSSSAAYPTGVAGGGGTMHRPAIARRNLHPMAQMPGSPSASGETDSDHSDSTNGAGACVDESGPLRPPRGGSSHGAAVTIAGAESRRFSGAGRGVAKDSWGGYFARGSGGNIAGTGGGRHIAPLAKLAAVATAGVRGGGGGAVEGLRCA